MYSKSVVHLSGSACVRASVSVDKRVLVRTVCRLNGRHGIYFYFGGKWILSYNSVDLWNIINIWNNYGCADYSASFMTLEIAKYTTLIKKVEEECNEIRGGAIYWRGATAYLCHSPPPLSIQVHSWSYKQAMLDGIDRYSRGYTPGHRGHHCPRALEAGAFPWDRTRTSYDHWGQHCRLSCVKHFSNILLTITRRKNKNEIRMNAARFRGM